MSKSLEINGKEYQASAVVAREFGYTSDYVSRLARERKIEASQVGRQWFIEVASLREFISSSEKEKEIRSKKLREQRQQERQLHERRYEQETKVLVSADKEQEYIAVAQSVAVMMCGLIVGLLGWVAIENHTGLQELAAGASDVSNQLVQQIVPQGDMLNHVAAWSLGAVANMVSLESVSDELRANQASVPVAVDEYVEHEGINSQEFLDQFSDEVEITFVVDEKGVARPVIRDRVNGIEYQVLIAPNNEAQN